MNILAIVRKTLLPKPSLILVAFASLFTIAEAGAVLFTDNFDDNTIDTFWWSVSTVGDSSIAEDNNRLEMVQGSSGNAQLTFNFPVTGDFTADVDFHLLNWPTNNQERIGLSADNDNLNALQLGVVERISDNGFGGEVYLTHFAIDGIQGNIPTEDVAGKLRLDRTDNTLSGFYWKDAGWVLIHELTHSSHAETTKINLSIWPESPITEDVTVAFDNFVLDAPTTVIPIPATALLFISGLMGLAGIARKRKVG